MYLIQPHMSALALRIPLSHHVPDRIAHVQFASLICREIARNNKIDLIIAKSLAMLQP